MSGQMLIVGFRGQQPTDPEVIQLSHLAISGLVGGVIFFQSNMQSPTQFASLMDHFKSLPTASPLLLCTDMEGGRVHRLGGLSQLPTDAPSAKEVARMSASGRAAVFRGMAAAAAHAQVNMVLGPVVDLDFGGKFKSEISSSCRSYGSEPGKVVEVLCNAAPGRFTSMCNVQIAQQYVESFRARKILTALKHYPGLGSSPGDSHLSAVYADNSELSSKETDIFHRLISANYADAVLVSHTIDSSIDSLPTSLSAKAIAELRLAYADGVIMADCMLMGAIAQHFSLDDAACLAVAAGNDCLIYSNNSAKRKCGTYELVMQIHAAFRKAVESGRLSGGMIERSEARLAKFKARIPVMTENLL